MKIEDTEKSAEPKRLALKKVTIVELSQEQLAMVSGGIKSESQMLTTSHFSCTGSLCCATEVTSQK